MSELKVHPAALLFPPIEGDKFIAFCEDIQANKLKHPIVLFEGAILDGRNRERACAITGVTAEYVTVKDVDPVDYVISANLHRRQLTTGQRAVIASELANMRVGGPGRGKKKILSKERIFSTSVDAAAKLLNVSKSSVGRARQIAKERPDLVSDLKAGRIKLSVASDRSRVTASRKRPPKEAIIEPDVERSALLFAEIAKERASDLPKTAAEKLQQAIRVHLRTLDLEFDTRVRDALTPLLVMYNREHDLHVRANDAYRGLYTPLEYKAIVGALHADRYSMYDLDATALNRLKRAFQLVESKRFELCGEKSEPSGTLPKTVDELLKMRKR